MSMWRPLFLRCMILDHNLQRMLNGFKIRQLNSERPLHQTAVTCCIFVCRQDKMTLACLPACQDDPRALTSLEARTVLTQMTEDSLYAELHLRPGSSL